jgi:two-component system, OmpR family, sensor kinase
VNRRRALAVFAAAVALLLGLNALVYSLYRSEVRTVSATLDDRLTALGSTAAKWLASNADASLLQALVSENRLEDAYIVDRGLRVVAGVRTHAGPLNLLRVDQDRLTAAQDGRRSVGDGYSVANARVEAAYFPVAGGRVLALEAGAEFHAPAARLYTTYLVAVGLSILAAAVFAVGLVLALRALERSRIAYGRAERLAAVGQMAAMVAHEVRNPLGILRANVELAREKLADAPGRDRERFDDMLAEIERINGLTQEFMSLARDVPLVVEPVELLALCQEIVSDAQLAVKSARIEATGIERTIDGDRGKLRQAIYNLVLNAAQMGAHDVQVEVGADRITVIDDGPGIPPEVAKTLFEPFVTRREGGTGLGLAVARRVAERHGGTIALEKSERGARFSIYLRGANGNDPGR